MDSLKNFDKKFLSDNIKIIAGVDEAGRGPLAGPVVAAAVIFKNDTIINGINDSKKISEKRRDYLVEKIKENAVSFSYGIIDQKIIDKINILQATLKAMKVAVEKLDIDPDLILIDGNKTCNSDIKTVSIVKGDGKSFSIGAASILAKVKRDEIMKELAQNFPGYNWEKNKGYGTKEHIDALLKLGPTEFHRKSFIKKIFNREIQEELL